MKEIINYIYMVVTTLLLTKIDKKTYLKNSLTNFLPNIYALAMVMYIYNTPPTIRT